MLYIVQATVTCTYENGMTSMLQVPTFLLDSQIQGIVSVQHAERIAREVINPSDDPRLVVSLSVAKFDVGVV